MTAGATTAGGVGVVPVVGAALLVAAAVGVGAVGEAATSVAATVVVGLGAVVGAPVGVAAGVSAVAGAAVAAGAEVAGGTADWHATSSAMLLKATPPPMARTNRRRLTGVDLTRLATSMADAVFRCIVSHPRWRLSAAVSAPIIMSIPARVTAVNIIKGAHTVEVIGSGGHFGILVYGCWGLFLIVWVVGAIYNSFAAPPARQQDRLLALWIAGIGLFVAFVLIPRQFWTAFTIDWPVLRPVGAALLIASTAWTLWARGVLGTMWTSSAVAKVGHELHTAGPYAVTRHPIYTGLLGMLLGTALIADLGPWLYGLVASVVVLELKIHAEERLLIETFGERYREYRRRVPQIIPGLPSRVR
jgi:protein-S-isoprenylcysteine O-methyltransferase Ste14